MHSEVTFCTSLEIAKKAEISSLTQRPKSWRSLCSRGGMVSHLHATRSSFHLCSSCGSTRCPSLHRDSGSSSPFSSSLLKSHPHGRQSSSKRLYLLLVSERSPQGRLGGAGRGVENVCFVGEALPVLSTCMPTDAWKAQKESWAKQRPIISRCIRFCSTTQSLY